VKPRLDDDQVEAQSQVRDEGAVRQATVLDELVRSGANGTPLAMVDGFLGEAEIAPRAPAHLDDDEGGRRTRVDGHEIELVATDVDVPGEDDPAGVGQPDGDQLFRGVTRALRRRSCPSSGSTVHAGIVAGAPLLGINQRSSRALGVA
jgi:hypothetical protein